MVKNWGIFKIIERKYWNQNPDFLYFDLDRYFHFANRISNQIWCSNQEPFKDWKVGDIIKIDLNWLIWHDPAKNDCTIRSAEIAQLVNSSSQLQLPPVWAVETGNYRWVTENNEEFQAVIEQQHFPLKEN